MEGASLEAAQLQGASLDGAYLQGAWLRWAGLQAASFNDAKMKGASLELAELQGARLFTAELEGVSFRAAYVWRADVPAQALAKGAFIPGHSARFAEAPEAGPKYRGRDCPSDKDSCDWSAASYAALKSLIENSVPAGDLRDDALKRIAKLEKPPYVQEEASAEAWAELAQFSPSADLYYQGIPKQLKEVGCGAYGGLYVIAGLIRNFGDRFGGYRSQEAAAAAAFLDEAKCPAARGISEADKAALRQIRDAAPAPPGPGRGPRKR